MTSLEEQIRVYKELALQIADLEQKKKELGLAILSQMPEKKVLVGDYIVRRYDRFSFKTTLEEARELDATKMIEVLDKQLLKSLHQSGQTVPGLSTFSFIQVSLQMKEGGDY